MAFKATVEGVTQSGISLEIDVLFTDDATGFSQRSNVHIQDASTATVQSAVAAITAVGAPLKAALAAYLVVKADIGAVITI